ncbi:Hydantoinase B/oxoprolinase-domain-containing protein [Aspergillus carlsbadensis]|nr:Hydantoinase B/oxoprolinase-domain-containing protein [Aspergillus carlsbadensis]
MDDTSTDVSTHSGSLQHVYKTKTAEVALRTPQLDISTVAAAGGSANRLFGIRLDVGFPVTEANVDAEASGNTCAESTTTPQMLPGSCRSRSTINSGLPLQAAGYMDNGSAASNFTGTAREIYGNLNAPKAMTFSTKIYVLWAFVNSDTPLNGGCLPPVEGILPEGTILSPSASAATVCGNGGTSQCVINTVLQAYQASGVSQGTCNNLKLGYGGQLADGVPEPSFGHYEAIDGGTGARPTWASTSICRAHESRILSPLSDDTRPCILREFSIRAGSGGAGLHRGGDGVMRDIDFWGYLNVSVLSEHRIVVACRMCGGEPGRCGENVWFDMASGPGGGGGYVKTQ